MLFGVDVRQLMVNCWFWGPVLWIPGIPLMKVIVTICYLGVARKKVRKRRDPNQQSTIS